MCTLVKEVGQPGKTHLRIIEVMKRFPKGISCGQIRHELEREGIPHEDLAHLDRCIRELDKWFIIEKTTDTQTAENKKQGIVDEGQITEALRAQILMGPVAVASAAARASKRTASISWYDARDRNVGGMLTLATPYGQSAKSAAPGRRRVSFAL